jgi:hypothetical protein
MQKGLTNQIYTGSERRRFERRAGHDRRGMIRWDPQKSERRSRVVSADRRKITDNIWARATWL